MIQHFVNRKEELKFLEEKWDENKPQLIIIYGRRRIGKSYLVLKFIEGKDSVYFLARKTNEAENSRRFLETLYEKTKDETLLNMEPTFDSVFLSISKLDKKMVIVIDEFSWLMEIIPQFASTLQHYWDTKLQHSKIFLALTGSSISMMESLFSYKNPLYGRRTGQWKVEPLRFFDIKEFFHEYNSEDLVKVHSIIGGVPFYLSLFDSSKKLEHNIKEKILNRGNILYEEVEFLLKEELKEPRNYLLIMKAIAEGKTSFGEIINATGIEKGNMMKYLGVLITLGMIERQLPVTKLKGKKGLYYLKDNYSKFWFNFVYPNKERIEANLSDQVLKEILSQLNTFVGVAFENTVKEFLMELNRRKLLPFMFSKIGKWWHKDKEIDLVALNKETKEIAFFEVKWKDLSHKEALGILEKLKEKSKFVKWYKGRKEYFGLIAKRIENKKELEKNYLVFDLKDIEKL